MKRIIFTNVNYDKNAGDFWSTPLKYYNFEKYNIEHIHFMDIWEALQNESNQEQGLIKNSLVVIGGGGLITTEGNFLQQTTEFLVQNNKVIFWGVGSNTFEKPSYNILSHPNVILSGIRDIVYGIDIEYLPCVSCKHSVFDRNFESTDYLGAIEHPRHPIDVNNIYKITNETSIDDIINFIGTKEIILSSTYHGIYWSQLLNKKVLYFKTTDKVNSKIINMKHRVPICTNSNYLNKIDQISKSDNMLAESRKLNDNFYFKVIELLDNYLISI
jgi:hypothetical protein